VYFDISKFKKYGRLSRLKPRQLKSGAGVAADEYSKDDVRDFVLWKAKSPGEPSWPAPFGAGRPGWHIECSAMSVKYLGQPFDIHTGGVDLIFPHHENEIAQSEGAAGKRFARFFAEGEHLLVNKERMAKSLGNFFTLRDIEKRGYNPLAFRYLQLSAHYRSKLNFTWDSLTAAQNSLERLYAFIRGLHPPRRNDASLVPTFGTKLASFRKRFGDAIADDLDIPGALAVLWNLIRSYNKKPEQFNPVEVRELLLEFDIILGLGLKIIKPARIPARILRLIQKRQEYRQKQEWRKADDLRRPLALHDERREQRRQRRGRGTPFHHLVHGGGRLLRGEVLVANELLEQSGEHHKSKKFLKIRRPSPVSTDSG
jgi:cysteinyl-tRNA synthetase